MTASGGSANIRALNIEFAAASDFADRGSNGFTAHGFAAGDACTGCDAGDSAAGSPCNVFGNGGGRAVRVGACGAKCLVESKCDRGISGCDRDGNKGNRGRAGAGTGATALVATAGSLQQYSGT